MEINTGDTAWVLTSTALVILMTPALGFFYGGLVRRKNVLSTLMHSFFILCLISVVWTLWGFTLAFGQGGRFIGDFSYIGLRDITSAPLSNAPTIPGPAFVMFQGAFAIITPALITGAFAERKRFKAFVLFSLLWSTLIYAPLVHQVWAPTGWIFKMGALDFAGGTVVHISSGISALVAALVIGKRVGFGQEEMEPHDLTMTVHGAGLLWFGWFGFNGGSALAANGLAAMAFLVTNVAAAMGALTWSPQLAPAWPAECSWRRGRGSRRSGWHHPGGRLCQSGVGGCDWLRRRSDLLLRARIVERATRR